jgi:hypothetical protein
MSDGVRPAAGRGTPPPTPPAQDPAAGSSRSRDYFTSLLTVPVCPMR